MTGQEKIQAIIDNVEKVIVGKRDTVEKVLVALISGGHVLIEDVPGVGKTTLIAALAKSLHASFGRIQFTPDVLPSDITGFSIYNQKTGEFEFRPGIIMSNIVLADEINRTSPKTQSSLLEAMEERQVTVDGVTYKLNAPFMVLATENPVEYIGTYPLPEAQIDRFFLKIKMGYPSQQEEVSILDRQKLQNPLERLNHVASGEEILMLQKIVKEVHVENCLSQYIVNITTATRNHFSVALGASVRGSLCLFRAAQAKALCEGRDFVIPDDIKSMVSPVLMHRIILTQEAKLRNITEQQVIDEIMQMVKVPVIKSGT